MSFKVSVLCENHTQDQYIIEPVIQAALVEIGKPHATVDVKSIPKDERGVDQLLERMCKHLTRWGGPSSAVIFIADADCRDGVGGREDRRRGMLARLEQCEKYQEKAIVVVAIQEAEVWALWGQRNNLGVSWPEVREECDPKERWFESLISNDLTPDGGRRSLMERSLAAGWQSLKTGCPELELLEADLRTLATT